MKVIQSIQQLFRQGRFEYDQYRYISKTGADIIPGEVPVPVGDELQCSLFKNSTYTLVTMCIYEKILWIIPYHYYEYIIWMKNDDIDFDNCTAEDIIDLMGHAVKWNQENMMRPDNRFANGTFSFVRKSDKITTHSYSVNNGDYLFMKMRNIKSAFKIFLRK